MSHIRCRLVFLKKYKIILDLIKNKISTKEIYYKLKERGEHFSYRTVQRTLKQMVDINLLSETNLKSGGNRNIYEVLK